MTCDSEGEGESLGFFGGGLGGVGDGQPWSCDTLRMRVGITSLVDDLET